MDKPIPLSELITFVRGARHLTAQGHTVELTGNHAQLLQAIEQRLVETDFYEKAEMHAANSAINQH